jgi:hypothetical protein
LNDASEVDTKDLNTEQVKKMDSSYLD